MEIFAERARLALGWAANARIKIRGGVVVKITTDASPKAKDIRVDTLLPAMANLHSHSFQRAFAGMTEYRAGGHESFWTWREVMYGFLERIRPEHITAFAGMAFMEMQKYGYASVGEFHYLHHQNGGQKYANPAETSLRIFEAAIVTGIGLTHLPVLYTQGGAGGRALTGGQLRFGNSVETFLEIVEECGKASLGLPEDTTIGIAPHSLRAVGPGALQEIVRWKPDGPVHIHIAEQVQEIEEIEKIYNARPVAWLMDNVDIGPQWCLVHATHMDNRETEMLAKSGAIVGLCPVTEANLGDGIFNGPGFLDAGGRFGIGTDSNVNIGLSGELRMLEYSQRLRHQERCVMVQGAGSVGEALYLKTAFDGAQALARNAGRIEVGALADLVAIDTKGPVLGALKNAQVLDGFIFAANDQVVTDLWSAGRHQVQGGHHVAQEQISSAYMAAIGEIMADV